MVERVIVSTGVLNTFFFFFYLPITGVLFYCVLGLLFRSNLLLFFLNEKFDLSMVMNSFVLLFLLFCMFFGRGLGFVLTFVV